MNKSEILEILEKTNVLQEGHFLLTSGKHSNKYMQCALLFQYPEYSEKCCNALAEKINKNDVKIDLIVSPAVGGIIMGYQMSACMNVKNIFAERVDGKMTLRRGFKIEPGTNVMVCEDVVTTGGSVKEVVELVKASGANVVCVCSIVDRSKGTANFGTYYESLISVDFDTYEADNCPLCAQGTKAIKPGSRNI